MSENRTPTVYNDNIFRSVIRQMRLAWQLFLDPRVNWMAKALPIISAIYVISPVDLIPAIPVISSMDDIAVAIFGLKLFIEFSPQEVVREHLRRIENAVSNWEVANSTSGETTEAGQSTEVVEGEFSVVDEESKE